MIYHFNKLFVMKKINWKAVIFDCVKACLAVIIGALAGSCTVYHLGITSVSVPDSTVVQSIDNSIKSITHFSDSVITNYYDDADK